MIRGENFTIIVVFFEGGGYNISMLKKLMLTVAKSLSIIIVLWWTFYILASHGFSLISLLESIIPLVLLGTTIIAWNLKKIGGVIFVLLGVGYIIFAWGVLSLTAYLLIAGPLILAGILFILAD
jgi:hypothetical protein